MSPSSSIFRKSMATPARAIANPSLTSANPCLVNSITILLQKLNPQNPNPSELSSADLNQFSPDLNRDLVIQVIKKQTNPYHALFFFNWASNPNPNPNNYSHDQFCYLAITDLLLSRSLFSTAASVLQQSNRLRDFMIGKFITAYGGQGNVRAAIDWFHRAKSIESGRCLYSFNAVVRVLVGGGRMNLAKGIFDQIVEEGLVRPNVAICTMIIRGFCRRGDIENARKVFDEMPCDRNLITYNTMLHGLCKNGDLEGAKRVFDQMKQSKECLPDSIAYTTLIDGYCKKGEMEKAMKCMSEMKEQGCEPTVFTYNALIHGLCLSGDVGEGKKMITTMRLNGVKDDLATHTTMLKGLCIAGKVDEAAEYLQKMASIGMKPDMAGYGVVFNAYCKLKKPDGAISLLREMLMRGLEPRVANFNVVLGVFVETGDIERAIVLLKQMPFMGCSPNFLSYQIVIPSLCKMRGRMREVSDLVDDMLRKNQVLDSSLYSCLIKGYCENGNVYMAMQAFCGAMDYKYTVSLESFSVLVKALCAEGKLTEAERLLEKMQKRCTVINLDSYRTVLDANVSLSGERKETT